MNHGQGAKGSRRRKVSLPLNVSKEDPFHVPAPSVDQPSDIARPDDIPVPGADREVAERFQALIGERIRNGDPEQPASKRSPEAAGIEAAASVRPGHVHNSPIKLAQSLLAPRGSAGCFPVLAHVSLFVPNGSVGYAGTEEMSELPPGLSDRKAG